MSTFYLAPHSTMDHSEAISGRLRTLNRATVLPPLTLVGVMLVVVDSSTWWNATVLTVSLVVALVFIERWARGDTSRIALTCLAITAGVWAYGALFAGLQTASYGLTIVGPTLIPQLRRHRALAAVVLVAFVGAVGAGRLIVAPHAFSEDLLPYFVVPTGVTAMATGLTFANEMFYKLMKESREREAELAVFRERVRFAGDLHDIQGHTLHVVKLKIALAEKLLDSDVGRAQEELREVRALVGDTITQTKELAHAERRLNLSVELENAKNLFEAAGIRVRVDRDPGMDERAANELLGQVLRETTTNILRHAQATHVRITLDGSGITIVNDGAGTAALTRLSGLSVLRERVGDEGGELTVEQQDGRFRTSVAFPALAGEELR
ncbi:histidine kinase [Streptomyces xiamenensis]|uniref:Histidine kinase n=1 Tax=Streptomyces xiamenensis TaxID=408015 RepID=A0A0F7FNW0_9ACTN|nr:histidine kinase [Streptomyces xiamenensis]AKG41658.1 histidine kinase [Streptomyces xiamenensis]